MARLTRRGFLAAGLAVPLAGVLTRRAAGQGLDKFMVPAGSCKDSGAPTPATTDDKDYRPGSPERTSLVDSGMAGTKMTLAGTVAGVTCGQIKGAVVDVWQADGRGLSDKTGGRLRAHQSTDAQGRYRFETIKPGAAAGRAPHFNLKVRVAGKANLTTDVFLPGEPANSRDPFFKPALLAKVARENGIDVATFDIVLDI